MILPSEGRVEDNQGGHFHLGCFQVMFCVLGSFDGPAAEEYRKVAQYIRGKWDTVEVACSGRPTLLAYAERVGLCLEIGTVIIPGLGGVDQEVEVIP